MKCFLVGYYGFGNIGDEWLLQKTKQWLNDHYTIQRITVRTPQLTSVLRAFFNSDTLVFGGGGLLQNKTSTRSLVFYTGLLIAARLFKKRRLLLAQGIGPLNGKLSHFLVQLALKDAELITVRDQNSIKILTQLGLKPKQVDDLSLYKEKIPQTRASQGTKIGLCLKGLSKAELHHISEQLKKLEKTLVYIPMQVPEDLQAVTHIQQNKELEILDINAVKQAILTGTPVATNLELIVSSRFHLCMHAALMGIPFIALAIDPKLESVAKQFGQPCVKPMDFIPI